ncbi:hypothetical protein FXO37_08915 [Capsicum annuum]|nr:hypothetical protein FXO37_08915 [Capsicum annuum]
MNPDYKVDPPLIVMVTGGRNRGCGVIKNRETHKGSFETFPIQDVQGHEFATRLGNVFTLGKGIKPWVSLPKVAVIGDGRLESCHRSRLGGFGSGSGLDSSLGLRAKGRKVRWDKVASRLRVGSWNIGTLQSKSIELVKILRKRKVSIPCVQKTKWVIEFKRVSDRLMSIKLVIGVSTVNVISAYTPQVGLDEEEKKDFWDVLDNVVSSIPSTEKLVMGGYFNGYIGSLLIGYDDVHHGFSFGERNEGGASLLDFSRAFGLWIANSSFSKK